MAVKIYICFVLVFVGVYFKINLIYINLFSGVLYDVTIKVSKSLAHSCQVAKTEILQNRPGLTPEKLR